MTNLQWEEIELMTIFTFLSTICLYPNVFHTTHSKGRGGKLINYILIGKTLS